MKIKKQNTIIVMIYSLVYLSILSYLRYTATGKQSMNTIRLSSMYIVVLLSVIYILTQRHWKKDVLYLIIMILIVYELYISYINLLFVFPIIMIDIAAWPLIIFVFYDFFRKNEIPKYMKTITFWGSCSVILFSIPNVRMEYSVLSGTALFASYFCITILPLIYIFFSKKIIFVFNVIVGVLMLLTMKRAAFLIIVVGLFLYYITQNKIEDNISNAKKLFVMMICTTFAILIGTWLINKLNIDILTRMTSIMEDGGSGRTRIWDVVINSFKSSPAKQRLFGHGFHAVFYRVKPLGISRYAHNSFLETLYDYGYMGVLILIIMLLYIFKSTLHFIKMKHFFAPIMVYTLVPTIILGFASYFFEQSLIILPLCVVWGVCLGTYKKDNSRNTYFVSSFMRK